MMHLNRRVFLSGAAASSVLGSFGTRPSQAQWSPNCKSYDAMYAASTILYPVRGSIFRRSIGLSCGPRCPTRRKRRVPWWWIRQPITSTSSAGAGRRHAMKLASGAPASRGPASPISVPNRSGRTGIRRRRCSRANPNSSSR